MTHRNDHIARRLACLALTACLLLIAPLSLAQGAGLTLSTTNDQLYMLVGSDTPISVRFTYTNTGTQPIRVGGYDLHLSSGDTATLAPNSTPAGTLAPGATGVLFVQLPRLNTLGTHVLTVGVQSAGSTLERQVAVTVLTAEEYMQTQDIAFRPALVGSAPEAQDISFQVVETYGYMADNFTLDDPDGAFEFIPTNPGAILGSADQWTQVGAIQPREGLAPGTYTATLTYPIRTPMLASFGQATCTVSYTVAADVASLRALEAAEHTAIARANQPAAPVLQADIYAGPGAEYPVIGWLDAGGQIEQVEWNQDNTWCKVRFGEWQNTGWLPGSYFQGSN